jgi:hypothetical protein
MLGQHVWRTDINGVLQVQIFDPGGFQGFLTHYACAVNQEIEPARSGLEIFEEGCEMILDC